MIKYKLIKFTLIFIIILILIFLSLLIRLSFKPLEVSNIANFIDNNSLMEDLSIQKYQNAAVYLKPLENLIVLNLKNVQAFKPKQAPPFNDIIIDNAEHIRLSVRASSLLKKQLKIMYIEVENANAKISLNINQINWQKSYNTSKSNSFLNLLKGIQLKNIDLEISSPQKDHNTTMKGLVLELDISDETIKASAAKVTEILYKDQNIYAKFYNSKLLVEENNISLDSEKINFSSLNSKKNNFNFLHNLFNSKNISFNKIKLNYVKNNNSIKLYANLEKKVPFEISGTISKELLFDGDLFFKLNNFYLNELPFKKYAEKNNPLNSDFFSDLIINGTSSFKFFQNKLLAGSFDYKLENKKQKKAYFFQNNLKFTVNSLLIKANILENQLEIENAILNTDNQQIKFTGKVDDIFSNPNANINFKLNSYNLVEFENFLKLNINKNINNKFSLLKIELGKLNDTEIDLNYFKNSFIIKNFKGVLSDAKIFFKNDFAIEFNNADLNFYDFEGLKMFIPRLNLSMNNQNLFLNKNTLILQDKILNNDKNQIIFDGHFKDSYKKIIKFLKEINYGSYKNLPLETLNGNIDAVLNLNSVTKNLMPTSIKVTGKLNNFNYIDDGNNLPVKVNNFNGYFTYEEQVLNIVGDAEINQSQSKLKVNLNKDNNLSVKINSNALYKSFNFLKDYNFLKSGTSKLELQINKKDIFHNKWTVLVNADLYNNNIKINPILYEKKENQKALLEAKYYFEGVILKKVEDLTLVADDIIMKGDIFLDERGLIKNINISEFIRELDNFQANISFEDNESFLLNIEGSQININNYFSENSAEKANGKININTDGFYLYNFNLGKVNLNSTLENNEIRSILGNIYNKKDEYVFLSYKYDNSFLSKFKLSFKDFGLFLKNIEISDKFFSGKGDIVLNVDNKTKNITSGEYLISDFSIKDASFLARLLQLASFTGLLEILSNDGIPFTNLDGSFSVEKKTIFIKDTRFEGLSLGASTQGSINLESKNLNLKGVLIPAYAINHILNKIPLVGKVITGIEGEGIIGFDYKATGSYENPEYSINPFSVLTPGIIRSIFKGLSKEQDKNKKNTTN